MKKIFLAFNCIVTTTLITNTITACNFINGGSVLPPEPYTPSDKPTISDYLTDIKNCQNEIKTVKADLKILHSKTSKMMVCGSDTMCAELQELIADVTANMIDYQVKINDDQYQIIMLESQANPNDEQKKSIVKYLKTAVNLLLKKRKIMNKSSDYEPSDYQQLDQQVAFYRLLIKK